METLIAHSLVPSFKVKAFSVAVARKKELKGKKSHRTDFALVAKPGQKPTFTGL